MDVKYYRELLDLTQEALAFGAGISRSKIAKWEVGECNPKALDDQLLRKFFKTKGITVPDEPMPDLMFSTNTSKILIDIREKNGFTIAQMAEKLNIKLKKYKKIEAGNFEQSHEKDIQAIDEILGTNLHKIIYQKEYTTSYISDKEQINQLHEDEAIYTSERIQVPYLPAYTQTIYLKQYTVSGKEIDANLKTIAIPKEPEEGYCMVIEIASNSMNNKTEKAICDGDKLLIQEMERSNWKKSNFDYKHNLFILFTVDYAIICREITNYNIDKEIFTLHAWNRDFADIDIGINDIHRIFYAKKIVERKIKLIE